MIRTSSEFTVAEMENTVAMYISASQDVRDPFAHFSTEDIYSTATSLSRTARPSTRPTPLVARNFVPDPLLPEEETRTAVASKVYEFRTDDLISEKATVLQRFKKNLEDNTAGYRQRRAISWVQAAKGQVQIQVTKKNTGMPDSFFRSAEDDGVILIDAVGGTDVKDQPLSLSLDDLIDASSAHSQPNLGTMTGIAGGDLSSGALTGMSFIVARPQDVADLLKEDRKSSAKLGNVTDKDVIRIGAKAPIIQGTEFPIFQGYPIYTAGLFDNSRSPATILDTAGDSIIVDNGNGSFSMEYDLIFGTGESVARMHSDVQITAALNAASSTIYNFSLENLIASLRLKGESLLFLRVTRDITVSQALTFISSGYASLVSGKAASQNRYDRLTKSGRLYMLADPARRRLEELAGGPDIDIERLRTNGILDIGKINGELKIHHTKMFEKAKAEAALRDAQAAAALAAFQGKSKATVAGGK